MANDRLRNDPDNPILVNPGTAVTTDPHLLSPDEVQLQRTASLTHEVRRLYAWLVLLGGLYIVGIAFLVGFAIWLKNGNDKLQQQVSTLDAYKAQADTVGKQENKIKALENQISLLNQNIGLLNQRVPKGLPAQITGIQNEISSLRVAIQKVQASQAAQQQVDQNLQRSLQDQNRSLNPATPPIKVPVR
ncbi:MAG: hypothetical protein NVS2B14_06230 [Chamaesiphon sp.]